MRRMALLQLACCVHLLTSMGSGTMGSRVRRPARSGRSVPLASTTTARQSVPSL